jgi:hypothetical protein
VEGDFLENFEGESATGSEAGNIGVIRNNGEMVQAQHVPAQQRVQVVSIIRCY